MGRSLTRAKRQASMASDEHRRLRQSLPKRTLRCSTGPARSRGTASLRDSGGFVFPKQCSRSAYITQEQCYFLWSESVEDPQREVRHLGVDATALRTTMRVVRSWWKSCSRKQSSPRCTGRVYVDSMELDGVLNIEMITSLPMQNGGSQHLNTVSSQRTFTTIASVFMSGQQD